VSNTESIDYGPLSEFIGIWRGNKGLDVSPEPDSAKNNPYSETTTVEIHEKVFEHTDQNELMRQ